MFDVPLHRVNEFGVAGEFCCLDCIAEYGLETKAGKDTIELANIIGGGE